MIDDSEGQATWNMNEETCKTIRQTLNECLFFYFSSKYNDWYKSLTNAYKEVLPIIKAKTSLKYEIIKKREKMIEKYKEFLINQTSKPGSGKIDVSSFVFTLEEFEMSLRNSLADDGILMAKADDPRFAFGGRH